MAGSRWLSRNSGWLRCDDASASKLHDIFFQKEKDWHSETLTYVWTFQKHKEHGRNPVTTIIFSRGKKMGKKQPWHLLLCQNSSTSVEPCYSWMDTLCVWLSQLLCETTKLLKIDTMVYKCFWCISFFIWKWQYKCTLQVVCRLSKNAHETFLSIQQAFHTRKLQLKVLSKYLLNKELMKEGVNEFISE